MRKLGKVIVTKAGYRNQEQEMRSEWDGVREQNWKVLAGHGKGLAFTLMWDVIRGFGAEG